MELNRVQDLQEKEVINVCTGNRLGFPCDVEIDINCGRVVAIVVETGCKYLGIFGSSEELVVPWDAIKRIGDDIILVDFDFRDCCSDRRGRGGRKR